MVGTISAIYCVRLTIWIGVFLTSNCQFVEQIQNATNSIGAHLDTQSESPVSILNKPVEQSDELVQDEIVVSSEMSLDETSACECDNSKIREQDEVWLVSSRHLPGNACHSTDNDQLCFERKTESGWVQSTSKEFDASTETKIPTILFVHGNRTNQTFSRIRGLQTYRAIVADCSIKTPIRYVIWSWPSDRIFGQVRDLRLKASVADQHSVFLARFIQSFDRENQIRLVGYSYGGRMAINALHLLHGGCFLGRKLPGCDSGCYPKMKVALIVPAVPYDCFEKYSPTNQALDQIEKVVLIKNESDFSMRVFRFFKADGCKKALGYGGPRRLPTCESEKFRQVSMTGLVSRHSLTDHLRQPRVVSAIKSCLFSDADNQ